MKAFERIREQTLPLLFGVAVCSVTMTAWLLDQGSKWLVGALLDPNKPRTLFTPWLWLHLRHNPNGAFDLFAGLPEGVRVASLVTLGALALAAIFVVSVRMLGFYRPLAVALGLFAGGALSNFADRLFRGVVIDFIDIRIGSGLHWPTFNLADVAITLGSLFLAVLLWQSTFKSDCSRQPKPGFFEEGGK